MSSCAKLSPPLSKPICFHSGFGNFFLLPISFSACSLDPPSANHCLARLSAFLVPGERFAVLDPAAMFVDVHTSTIRAIFAALPFASLLVASGCFGSWPTNHNRNRQIKYPVQPRAEMVEVAVCEGRA